MKSFKLVLLGAIMGMWVAPTFAQEDNSINPRDGNGKPGVHITVHKQTDKNGNIVSYDSTYSYTYSGNGADTAMINNMLKQFGGGMNSSFFGQSFDSIPGTMNNPFFRQFNFNGEMDISKMQEEMQQQMQQFMQGNGWPVNQGIYIQIPAPTAPVPTHKHIRHPAKKVVPKQNNSDEGVQI